MPNATSDVPTPPDVGAGLNLESRAGSPVVFNGRVKDINPSDTHTVRWDFGDGDFAIGTLTPRHSYLLPGRYIVTLSVTDSTGFTTRDSIQVTVGN